MSWQPEKIFDFELFSADTEAYRELVAKFAEHEAFRSAVVEELELDEDFYRRPLRPEDLTSIKFKRAVTPDRISLLPSLASQRMLLCINELDIARLPKDGRDKSFREFHRYYGGAGRVLAARIRPFLESYVFNYLAEPSEYVSIEGYVEQLREMMKAEALEWSRLFDLLACRDYVEEGLRFIMVQRWSLLPSKRSALSKANALGFFDALADNSRPQLMVPAFGDDKIRRLAEKVGITKREHSYWQFYLSTSLGQSNLLHAFAARPDRAFALIGAAFAAEVELIGFCCLVGQGLRELGLREANVDAPAAIPLLDDILGRFRRALQSVHRGHGELGLAEVAQGFVAAKRLNACAWSDILEQMRWISAVDRYQDIAQTISRRIETERPDIDRETFVEPKEMCSTTHVHNDHRLVVIESGDMVFWANLGMTLRMKPGEMVLVPKGRLHGSSIESDECIYHQPIIPPEWIEPLVNDLNTQSIAN